MTWQEMIENAHLDALGLLDEQERERFDAAFLKLPADLKAQLRAEQDRAVRFDLSDCADSDIELPAEMKATVLAAIRAAAGKSQTVEHKAGRILPMSKKSRAVSAMWRASALGLAAACVVMGGVIVQLLVDVQSVSEQSRQIGLSKDFGAQFPRKPRDIAFSEKTLHTIFKAQPGFEGEATVFHHPDWTEAHFQCLNFPSHVGQKFKIVLLDSAGNAEKELAVFESDGGRTFKEIKVATTQLSSLAIVQINDDGTETIVMKA